MSLALAFCPTLQPTNLRDGPCKSKSDPLIICPDSLDTSLLSLVILMQSVVNTCLCVSRIFSIVPFKDCLISLMVFILDGSSENIAQRNEKQIFLYK